MKKLKLIILCVFSSALMAEDIYHLKFDHVNGTLINPDQQYLVKGLKDQEKEHINSALDNFTLSAEYGNYIAMSMIAQYHLKNKKYIESMAWLQLIDVDKLTAKEDVVKMLTELEAYLRSDEMLKVKERSEEIKKVYGPLPAFLKRKHWRENVKISGSRTKFSVPSTTVFKFDGGAEVNALLLINQLDDYVYNHEFSDQDAVTILNELKISQ